MMIEAAVNGDILILESHPALFSPRHADAGTLAMLEGIELSPQDYVLDLGCGYGLVGIWAARRIGVDRVVMADIDPLAVDLAHKNAARNGVGGIAAMVSDGLADIQETGFTFILCNPPYNADFSVPKRWIEKGFNRLSLGGKMMMVTRREAWYRNKLAAIFGGVRVTQSHGYYVFTAEKRQMNYAKGGSPHGDARRAR